MTRLQRIKEVFAGIFMILGSLIIMLLPEEGYLLVALILGLTLFIRGLRTLVYYFSMARHMVDGKLILYMGVVLLDFGVFAMTLPDIPAVYVVLYLLVCHGFSGAVDIMRAFEARRYEGQWKLNMGYGLMNILIAILAFAGGVTSRSVTAVVYIYGSGLVYSAIVRIVRAFRKSAIVYIQ